MDEEQEAASQLSQETQAYRNAFIEIQKSRGDTEKEAKELWKTCWAWVTRAIGDPSMSSVSAESAREYYFPNVWMALLEGSDFSVELAKRLANEMFDVAVKECRVEENSE